ncbi:nostrin isoform X2 [Parambassis ranga]|uniref:Osteoclast-stimulating factor 1 n=1 Tax=Parambassis ranga TaxID=210632 RepID=A0A6P7HF69_9TELE|nr:nostrin isoform X2 [Parambassis ranga]
MKDPISTCSYNQLYQNVKRYSKSGEYFCKELMTALQQRAELEFTYAKGLQKLAGKLIRASKGMSNKSLGNAFQQEAILEIRQVLDEHNKRKRPLDNAVERSGKLVTANWSEQLKVKKKLVGLTREHEALFNFIENNKHICTEKEKQKMLNRLTKSAEMQARVDEEYFNINMEGYQMRIKWENTLKNCHQIVQELEKQRIEVLCNILSRYNLHMSSFGQTLKHGQKQIEQAVQRVNMDKDIQAVVEENSITAEENKAEFLMADYFVRHSLCSENLLLHFVVFFCRLQTHSVTQPFKNKPSHLCRVHLSDEERVRCRHKNTLIVNPTALCSTEEDSKSLMGKDRRREAIKLKLQRLEDSVATTKKDCEGIEKLMKMYSDNPSFSNQKNLEETEQQLDESTLKLDLLEATHYKLSMTLSELEGKPKSFHRFSDSIMKWKDKDCEHSIIQLTRPVKLRRTPFRSRQSLRASIIYKGPAQFMTQQSVEPLQNNQLTSTTASTQETVERDSTVNGDPHHTDDQRQDQPTTKLCSIGKCKAIYDFTPGQDDELPFKEGDLLDIYSKEENGWWFGTLNGQTGHFPSTYVEELPVLNSIKSSDA